MTITAERFNEVRKRTERLTAPLSAEDFVVQPIVDVSPPKWHLGHTTWFFETFVLSRYKKGHRAFDPNYNFLFNSYYESIGARTLRTDRGNLTRPGVEEVLQYRAQVNSEMAGFLQSQDFMNQYDEIAPIIELGLQHEQQHQELLVTDIKYILGHNPVFPNYEQPCELIREHPTRKAKGFLEMPEGMYEIGHKGPDFCFDNELGNHRVFLHNFLISNGLVTNGEYLEFIEDGGYGNFIHWLAEGWDWVKSKGITAPEYWHNIEGEWFHYTLEGLQKIDPQTPVTHVSYYEADAFANWKNKRLPTEFEWEAAADKLNHGQRWEWTHSAYLAYPGYRRAAGAIGEYNGKFMINQMVLRGGSCATPPGHFRKTYRNFFHPHLKWQYTGIRLAEKITL